MLIFVMGFCVHVPVLNSNGNFTLVSSILWFCPCLVKWKREFAPIMFMWVHLTVLNLLQKDKVALADLPMSSLWLYPCFDKKKRIVVWQVWTKDCQPIWLIYAHLLCWRKIWHSIWIWHNICQNIDTWWHKYFDRKSTRSLILDNKSTDVHISSHHIHITTQQVHMASHIIQITS
jgi:hypothetical protein